MNDGRMNDMFKQMDELFAKVDNLTIEIDTLKKKHKKEINKLKKEHKKEIQVLKLELKKKDEKGNFNVPQKHKKHIVYGDNLKALAVDLMYESYNSTDVTQNIISSITDNSIELPKSTLMNWSKEAKEKLMPEIENIEKELLRM